MPVSRKKTTRKTSTRKSGGGGEGGGGAIGGKAKKGRGAAATNGAAEAVAAIESRPPRPWKPGTGKALVIVESPAKAKTINKYLGGDYVVKATYGHIRDLPEKNPKGVKSPVPGVNLEHNFEPTYDVLSGKSKSVSELRSAAKNASDIWFATDLDREGEAIAWHTAHLLGVNPADAKRVVFNAITKAEIQKAFSHPHPIDQSKVDAQQARRVLDRIVGYQVSPLLWKKVARGLSAGRVQSVAVRLIVEREREIRAFVPGETWSIIGRFALDEASARALAAQWPRFMAQKDEKGNAPTLKAQNAWLADQTAIRAELVRVGDKDFEIARPAFDKNGKALPPADLTTQVRDVAHKAGLNNIQASVIEDAKGRGAAKFVRRVWGEADPSVKYRVASIETKRTKVRPAPPFITSTMQQAASNRLGFGAQRTMSTAQRLYEGIEIPGEGSVGLITYMRTDSTHLSGEAIESVREHIGRTYGKKYLPDSPNFFASSNKAAQEAHEAIRPTSMQYPPERVRNALKPEQFKLYKLIWDRFVACQMVPAEWDSTSVLLTGGRDPATPITFRATGRVLAFDGFYRVAGVPTASDEQTLPALKEQQTVNPFAFEPRQAFDSPPPRFTEASLIKTLEAEGIGRPSTYASIISVIQDRKYVELFERRFHATDLGEVVTDKLIEGFPDIMGVGYTRDLETQLDQIEEEHKDWVTVLRQFYGPFRERLDAAHDEMVHAKAETVPAPAEYKCDKCGAGLVYRFGRSGRFLSCSRYPDCEFACPCDREGKPRPIENAGVACHQCGRPMFKRTGRFGPFLGCSGYPECDGILKFDKQGRPIPPALKPLTTDLPCSKCQSPLSLRNGVRGPWLSCSAFPKCRGRGKWAELPEDVRAKWERALAEHEKSHPLPIIRDLQGKALTDDHGKPIPGAYVTPGGSEASGDGGAESPADEVSMDQAT